jgi:hypothetical protein
VSAFVINPYSFKVPFVPSDLSGLIMWLDANDTSTLFDATTGGSNVTTNDTEIARWEDKSTSAKHFTQSTSANRPKLFTSSQNSNNVIRFDGSNDSISMASSFSGLSEACYFIALKRVLDPPTTQSRTGHPMDFLLGSGQHHYPWIDGVIYDSTLTNSRKTTVNPTPSLANFHLYNVEAKSNLWTSRLNKSQIFTTATNTFVADQGAVLGGGGGGYWFDGDIGELIAYSSILSSDDRNKVEDYLYDKWGI